MTYEQIEGWFNYPEIFDAAVKRANDGAVFVEVGCWLGRSTAYLAQKIKDSGKKITLYAVDWGFGSPEGKDYYLHQPMLREYGGNVAGKFVSNLLDCGVLDFVVPVISNSVKASMIFADRSLDFVFIDAGHDERSVWTDLHNWWRKVNLGGVMAGHDYDGCWLEVCETVDRFFGVNSGYRDNPGEPITTFPFKDPDSEGCWSRQRISHSPIAGPSSGPKR